MESNPSLYVDALKTSEVLPTVFTSVDSLMISARDLTVPLPSLMVIDASLVEQQLAAGPVANARSSLLKQVPFMIVGDDDTQNERLAKTHGAADTLPKPLVANDLVAKMNRLTGIQDEQNATSRLRFNLAALAVDTPAKGPVTLTPREYQILSVIYKGEQHTAARRELFACVWSGVKVCNKVLDVHVSKLRRKLLPLELGIRFVKPNGYQLDFGAGAGVGLSSGAWEAPRKLAAAE